MKFSNIQMPDNPLIICCIMWCIKPYRYTKLLCFLDKGLFPFISNLNMWHVKSFS